MWWCFFTVTKYPQPGGGQNISVAAKPTSDLLLAGDTMTMLVNFITAQTSNGDEADYQYRVLKVRDGAYFVHCARGVSCAAVCAVLFTMGRLHACDSVVYFRDRSCL